MDKSYRQRIGEWCDDILRILFPDVCEVCGSSLTRGEKHLCLHCLADLPVTNLHHEEFNTIHQRLAGNVPIVRAGGYFYYYQGSDYAKLIHTAKYHNRPTLIKWLAMQYATTLLHDGFFEGIDMIVPVPIHWTKKITRGYNQSEWIADGISEVVNIEVADNLVCHRKHKSQTRLSATQRRLIADDTYSVIRSEELENKHLLLVDDVITTGATLYACCKAVHEAIPSAQISVLSIGVTHQH